MALGTLSLPKRKTAAGTAADEPKAGAAVATPPVDVPVYDQKKCSELRGGVGLVQGQHVFTEHGHKYIKTLPKEQGYFLTPEQEANYSKQIARQRAAIVFHPNVPPPPMPEKAVQIARENAQALAAEEMAF